MTLKDSLQVAIEALIANQLRAFLTMLGIVIGVGAVIALMAIGQGSQNTVEQGILGLGTNLIYVQPGSTTQNGVRQQRGSSQTLTLEDANAIQSSIPNIDAVAPEADIPLRLNASGQNTFAQVKGVTPDYETAYSLQIAQGSFVTSSDMDSKTKNLILGATVAQTLFPNANPIGQEVRLSLGDRISVNARVTGVLATKGGDASTTPDNQVFLPLTTVQSQVSVVRRSNSSSVVSEITVQASNKDKIDGLKQSITQLLEQRHQVTTPDFTVESQQDLANAANQANAALTVLLGAIASISLIVGGIGIMNIMLVSVTERTREIGIRKAVGARKRDILMQFLTEAVTVTALGGLLGIAAGLGTAHFLNGRNIAGLGQNIQTSISWTAVIAAFAVSASIGIFFGLYPASRAANLRPIEALRYE